jgi:hypothetical protein
MLHATAHWKATIFLHKYKKFQKIPKKLQSQQPAQISKKPFWLTLSFRG